MGKGLEWRKPGTKDIFSLMPSKHLKHDGGIMLLSATLSGETGQDSGKAKMEENRVT